MSDGKEKMGLEELRRGLDEEVRRRREAEKAIERERTVLDRIIELSPYGMAATDGDGVLLKCNRAFLELVGAPPESPLFADPHLEAAGYLPELKKLKEGKPVQIPLLVLEPERSGPDAESGPTYSSGTFIPVVDESGNLYRVIALNENLTRKMNVEKVLMEREAKYRALVDVTGAGYLILDESGHVVDANAEYVRQTGRESLEEILGRTVVEWTAPHDKERNAAAVLKCMETGSVTGLEIDYISPGGKITPIEVNAKVIRDENGFRILSTCRDITARKEAEESLRLSEEKYRTLVESANDVIFTMDLGGNFLFVNKAFERILGYTGDEAVSMRALDPVHPDDIGTVYGMLEKLFRGERVENFEHRYRTADGEYKHMLTGGEPITDSEGHTIGILGITRDITDLKEVRGELEASEKKYRSVVETIQDIILITDPAGKYLFVNPAFEKFHGVTVEEALRMTGFDFIHPEDRERAREFFTGILEGSRMGNLEFRTRSKDGVYMNMLGSGSRITDPEGTVTGVLGIVRDISDLKRAQSELRDSEEQFRLAFESAKDAIFWADAETGKLLNCNRSAEKLLERRREEIIGMHQTEVHPPDNVDKYIAMFRTHVDSNGALDAAAEVLTKSGRRVPVHISSSLTSLGGRPINQGIFRDITDLKRAQEEKENLQRQLLQSQKMEAIGNLAGGMAHDFNNSLAVILGNSEIALRKLKSGGAVGKHLEKIVSASERSRDLTMKLLTFARKDILNVRVVSVNAVLGELVDILKRSISKKIKIEGGFRHGKSNVAADVNQILQALLNICINACDAMPDGGTLEIKSREIPAGSEPVHPDCAAGCWLIEVRDSGQGIPPEIRDRIFDPFYTTKEAGKGTGLGLSIALGIVRNHGGSIKVESEPGRWTAFSIYLPASAEPEDGGPAAGSEPEPGHREKVMIVDDDADFVEMTAEALELAGYEPVTVSTGREAVKVFSENKGEIDLLLLDMQMPEMDGTDVFNALSEIDRDVKVILCSGYSMTGKASELLERGARAFLQKPFSSEKLSDTINEILKT